VIGGAGATKRFEERLLVYSESPLRHHTPNERTASSNPSPSANLAPALYSLHEVVGTKPCIAAISDLNSGPLIDGVGLFFSECSFLSGALDSANSVRFSKFECFEQLVNPNEMGFFKSSRTGKSIRF
jgi:hypothetical protein